MSIQTIEKEVKLMDEVMTNQPIKQLGWSSSDIPFSVDISVGPNWGSLEEVDLIAA